MTKLSPVKTGTNDSSFSSFLKNALDQVNQDQIKAEKLTENLVAGQVTDLHQVTIAAQKAELSLQLTVQVRNKIIEAYQEVMRMQV
nr:flagellar hook-basal body complex protein FliE [Microaerobacter geothermalis]